MKWAPLQWQLWHWVSALSDCCQTVSTANRFREIRRIVRTTPMLLQTSRTHNRIIKKQLLTHKKPYKPPLKERHKWGWDVFARQTEKRLQHRQYRLSTETTARTEVRICNSYDCLASLGVVHPVQNDLRRPVPTGHHVARHLSISTASQPKVQDLSSEANRSQRYT